MAGDDQQPAAEDARAADSVDSMDSADSIDSADSADFGYQRVDAAEHTRKVGEVFGSVAARYDLMNDLMSLGAHRLWKRFAASQSGLRRGGVALDVAGGSGDLSQLFARQVGAHGLVMLTDINAAMLARGRDNLLDAGIVAPLTYAQCDAEQLCLRDDSVDCAAISFGLRNVTRKRDALVAMHRVIRPGGRLLLLEFARPIIPALRRIYDLYSFNVIPTLGRIVADDERSYRYLVESIRRYPDRDAVLMMLRDAGFEDIRVHNLSGGIVTLHVGLKY